MNRLPHTLLLLAALLAARVAIAQDDEEEPAKKSPAGKPAAADKATGFAKPDLVLETIRDSNPTTPEALTRTVQTLLDYGQPVEAKRYLAKLIETKPDQTVLLELHRKFGPAFFMQLGRDQRMAPEGANLSRSILDTAQAAARDSMRLTELVAKLKDPSEQVRREAVVDLHDAGQLALPPLLNALADPGWTAEYEVLRDVMVELGEHSVEPLLGSLESPDMAFRARVADALGRIHTRRAVPYLVGPSLSPNSSPELRQAAKLALKRILGETPTQYDAEQYLARRAKSYLSGEPPRQPSYLGFIDLWHWDEGQKVPVMKRYLAIDAALIMATRAAADLYNLAPKNSDYRRLYLTAGLEMQKMLGGMGTPLPQGPGTVHEAASAAGVEAVQDMLAHALKQNYVAAAAGACEVLGGLGTAELLVAPNGVHPPLAQALRHGDRRLRFAAAEAVLRLDPRESYPGSSYVMETLGYVAGTGGVRKALVIHPQALTSQTLVGLLCDIGFEADAAATGRRGFQMASEGTDYELIMIGDAVDRPDTNELLQMLRRDPRTARVPVGLMFRAETESRIRRLAEDDPLTQAMPRPHSPESIGFEVERMLVRAGRNRVSTEERLVQASRALGHLKHIAERAELYPFYDLLRQTPAIESALNVPELSAKAAEVLGCIGTPLAQRSLATVASQNSRPLEVRQAAAAGFAEAVKRRGTLLTTSEIRKQYDLYNLSETLDAETQAVLASILDAMESRVNLNKPEATETPAPVEKPAPAEEVPAPAEEPKE